MSEQETELKPDLLNLTGQIVSAHVANNVMPAGDVPAFISAIYGKLCELQAKESSTKSELEPAVPVTESVRDEYIICLEDGKKLTLLKRHLKTVYSMTPEEYRARWDLPSDYPMVAPAYTRKRQALAKQIGLGKKPKA